MPLLVLHDFVRHDFVCFLRPKETRARFVPVGLNLQRNPLVVVVAGPTGTGWNAPAVVGKSFAAPVRDAVPPPTKALPAASTVIARAVSVSLPPRKVE